ncbi:MAG: hypothetical protein JWR16_59 [Nevskia sp.]|nr:hypothetical protein [Nevskia sp.]
MGLLDSVLSNMLAGGAQANSSGTAAAGSGGAALLQAAIGLLNSPQVGGLPGLVQKFEQAGLGQQISSWIGTGANLPINAGQLQQALSPELINGIAQKIGIAPDLVTQGLAQILPHVVDHATPNGQLQTTALLDEGLSLLKGKLFG